MDQKITWQNQKERGARWAFTTTVFVYKILGRKICSLIIFPVATYFYLTGKDSKKASLKYLNKIYSFPEGKKHFSKHPGFWSGHKHFLTFAFSILDKFAVWMQRITYDDIIFPNRQEIINQINSKKGMVLLTAHYGNIEIMRAVSQTISHVPVNVIMDRRNAESFNKLLKNTNQNFDVSIFASEDIDISTASLLMDKINQGEIVAVMADRLTENSATRTETREFLGEMAHFPQGPFIIPWLLKAPTYIFICSKVKNKYEVNFKKICDLDDFQKLNRHIFIKNICDQFVNALEKQCLKDPWQWFNFYDFWRNPEDKKDVVKK